MAQVELTVLRELKTSTREHKVRWDRPSEGKDTDWTADVGQYDFTLNAENPHSPLLHILSEGNEVAVIQGPEVMSLLRTIEEESKQIAREEKNARLSQVLVTLEAHREAPKGAIYVSS